MKRFPNAINSLGERICPGCGTHFTEGFSPYCSQLCRGRVWNRGGRLDRAQIAERIAKLGPIS
jgi:hypothetical protein